MRSFDPTREAAKSTDRGEELRTLLSHQLRTPLASLRGLTELLIERNYPPAKQRALLETLHRETERLTELVSDLIDPPGGETNG